MSAQTPPPSPRASDIRALFDLTGHVALVTGGSSGIGGAIAQALAGAGAAVVLVARREPALREAAKAIGDAGGQAAYVVADVSDRKRLPECVAEATRALGAPDILVNAAGSNLRQPAADITTESWDEQLTLNLATPFFLARELVPGMAQRRWGRIINVASLQSQRAFPNSIPYGAAKGGVVQLTRAMAEAWSAAGITCNAIAPGLFPTPLTAAVYANPKTVADFAARTMLGRNGDLPDLYGIAVFLASPGSGFITGQTVYVDGGFTSK